MSGANGSQEQDYGLNAYNEIQAMLQLWGSPSSSASPGSGLKSPSPGVPQRSPPKNRGDTHASGRRPRGSGEGTGRTGYYNDANDADVEGVTTPLSSQIGGPSHSDIGSQARFTGDMENTHGDDSVTDLDTGDDIILGDGADSFGPYYQALLSYLRSKDRLSSKVEKTVLGDIMDIDGEGFKDVDVVGDDRNGTAVKDATEEKLTENEIKYLENLSAICFSRCGNQSDAPGEVWSEEARNEGNFWHLLVALRTCGLTSLFYCVNDERPQMLEFLREPRTMVKEYPADVLDHCLWGSGQGQDSESSLPFKRLNAALNWIQACNARRLDDALDKDNEGSSDDPILPPPRRRTMWPETLASLKRKGKSSIGLWHPDAPLQSIFGLRPSSPVDVTSSFLAPEDEVDDARLLRACFMLFQAGRGRDAMQLVKDCGQPWRAVGWIGGEPLASDGSGNPNRALWKKRMRDISRKMAGANSAQSLSPESKDSMCLYPSFSYEAAIITLLADDVDSALGNPVFQTWEDAVHSILHAERGVIEESVLNAHNEARVEAVAADESHFPYPGVECDVEGIEHSPAGHGADLGMALAKLDSSSVESVRNDCGELFRNGMTSFLVGQSALKEYLEESATCSIESGNMTEAYLLRFVTHLVVYIESVLPGFTRELSFTPSGLDKSVHADSLHELLLLKYVEFLSSRRDLWEYVALYSSLLSYENIVATYANFLVHVHSDSERRMALNQARELFPEGLDCIILQNVVRTMITSDGNNSWSREPGEEAAPSGVTPADARMMKSILWLCYYPEHGPDALVCANMLLRRFILTSSGELLEPSNFNLIAPKVFIDKILPKDFIKVAMEHCYGDSEANRECISLPLVQNLKAEFLSIQRFLQAHTMYSQFLDVISETSPCCDLKNRQTQNKKSELETEIADKMERNSFRQQKMGVCKIVIEYANRVSDSLMEVLTFAGGWFVDEDYDVDSSGILSEEAELRADEMKQIRSIILPMAISMQHEVLNLSAMWMEQMIHDTLYQFGNAGQALILSLLSSFGEATSLNSKDVIEVLTKSQASPAFWHKKALSLASTVADEGNGLNKTFDFTGLEDFMRKMAESHAQLNRCMDAKTFLQY